MLKTKKLLILSIFVFSFFVINNPASAFSGGDGTQGTPYQISTCTELQDINTDLDAYYILINDIDCSDTETWNENLEEWEGGTVGGTLIPDEYTGVINNGYFGFEPIGQDDAQNGSFSGFTGSLDGQGYTISDLWIFRKDQSHTGLIGYATGATIKNLSLDNVRIVGGGYTGSIIGFGTGVNLENLTNNQGMVRAYLSYSGGGIGGRIEQNSTSTNLVVNGGFVHGSGNMIGGLIGVLHQSTVSSSTASADVDGGEYIGGAFGWINTNSYVTDVEASGDVVSNAVDDLIIPGFSKNGRYTGGFAGYIETSIIENATASGSVTADDDYAGGFAGSIQFSDITEATASGIVSGDEYIGGFAGSISASDIIDSVASGLVQATSGFAGGFSGQSICESTFLRSSALGNVQAGGNYVGGFTGYDGCEGPGSIFTQVSAHGDVTTTSSYVGGFVGDSDISTFINAYASGNVSGSDFVGGFAGQIFSGDLENVYSRGSVSAGGSVEYAGGFAGEVVSTEIVSSYIDNDTSGQSSVCGAGDCAGVTILTTSEAKTQSVYDINGGWDFESIWQIDLDNSGYPHFSWENIYVQLPGSGTEEDPYEATQCFVASYPGYYQLQNDIEDITGNCISIEADGVFINGAGHTLSGIGDTGGTAIVSIGYNSINISDIIIESFVDGIRLTDIQGESLITNVTISSTTDDGIDLRGVSDFTISNSTITNINDDGITMRRFFSDEEQEILNNNILIQNLSINGTGDFGMDLDYITNLQIIDNEISQTEDDGINVYIAGNVNIIDNILSDLGSDGIYIESANDVQILRNTISDIRGADGIDIDDDSEELSNSGFIIADNIFSGIGDVGIEIADLSNSTINGNSMEVNDMGIDLFMTSGVVISNNIITPTENEFLQIPSVSTESTEVNFLEDAENGLSATFSSFNYTLPFTFNFMGRDITSIEVGVNGSVELLEDGESCQICGGGGNYNNNLFTDTIFASFDYLSTEGEGNYVAVFNQNDESVVVEWRGTTMADNNSVQNPIHFQVILYPNGEVQWNFMQMDFVLYEGSMFSGAYDVVADDLYRVGSVINEPSSFRADLSGNTEYELIESFDSITGIRFTVTSDIDFIGNSVQSERWVESIESENLTFNDSDSGNTYRLTNGNGAWTVFDIKDTNGNGYAESGADRPFNQTVLGSQYWSGSGEDLYPGTELVQTVTKNRSRSGSKKKTPQQIQNLFGVNRNLQDDDKKNNEDQDQGSVNSTSNGMTVNTTRELQRFLNTNGFPVALSGPGSLNNETDIFGELTRQALAKFQKANGISPALGIFGPITKAFINKTSQSSAPTTNTNVGQSSGNVRNLEIGSTGDDVIKLQQLLINLGFSLPSGATGYFGQQTKDALISYQKANGISPALGIFGPMTRAKMKSAGVTGLWW